MLWQSGTTEGEVWGIFSCSGRVQGRGKKHTEANEPLTIRLIKPQHVRIRNRYANRHDHSQANLLDEGCLSRPAVSHKTNLDRALGGKRTMNSVG
ncbi:hypothetical protein VTK56DRAFT_9909 [Thermocarpiscus australiensis]